jgi:hypothetical protein
MGVVMLPPLSIARRGFAQAIEAMREVTDEMRDGSNKDRLRRRIERLNELFLSVTADIEQGQK